MLGHIFVSAARHNLVTSLPMNDDGEQTIKLAFFLNESLNFTHSLSVINI